jgi:hypothetical protein
MALFMQQVGALDRRRAQARQAEEAGRRAAFERDCTRTEAMIGGMEGFLKQVAEPRAEPLVAAPPTPEPEPPLNRQQRRALAKRQRKAQKRLANAA